MSRIGGKRRAQTQWYFTMRLPAASGEKGTCLILHDDFDSVVKTDLQGKLQLGISQIRKHMNEAVPYRIVFVARQ